MTSTLDAERAKSGLSARELTYVLHKGRAHTEKLERLEALLVADPVFNSDAINYLPRDEQYKRAMQMAGRVEVLARRNQLSEEDTEQLRLVFQGFTGCAASTTLHTLMFTKNLGLLFTDAQQAEWMRLAKEWKIVGCYAQTELGHGSNVRGLETTATFLPDSDEFEIHSPTLSSIKWWPGALARTANFGIVYARLLLHGKDHGVHNFMVQLRDLETHEPRPGCAMGDIGPKIGFHNVDNGYCKFDRVRIPRAHMAMRAATVDRQGTYRKNTDVPHEILYFTMLQTRLGFVRSTGLGLAKGATIAIRYSAVRAQGYDANDANGANDPAGTNGGSSSSSSAELKVLDYQTQQHRLFPLLAAAYAITLAGNNVDEFTTQLSQQMQRGDLSLLNVGHAISCGLKVLTTDIASAGLETCRRACGGHGYLLSSGIPVGVSRDAALVLLGDLVQTVTAEGENYVLAQQTARALLKVLAAFRAGRPLPDSMKFIAGIDQAASVPRARSQQQWLEPATYVSAFQQRFLHQLRALEREVAASASVVAGIQEHSVASYRLSMAYSRLLLVSSFADAVASRASVSRAAGEVSPALLVALRVLSQLFALTQLEGDAGEFMESGCVLPAELPLVRANVAALLLQVRPHAVVLVDGFNFSDHALHTTLGRRDGRPYEALYASVQHDPVNRGSDKVALHELLLPIREEVARGAGRRARL